MLAKSRDIRLELVELLELSAPKASPNTSINNAAARQQRGKNQQELWSEAQEKRSRKLPHKGYLS
jgi:hypothetical protein